MHSLEVYNPKQPDNGTVPSTTAIFVSLYLILLCFFIVLTKDLSLDEKKSQAVMRSVYQKFGKPESENDITFGSIRKPILDDFVTDIEKLFGEYATVQTTIDGHITTITTQKSFFFFEDEASFRPDKTELLMKIAQLMKKWSAKEDTQFTILLSLDDYQDDKQKLESLKLLIGNINIDFGIQQNGSNEFVLIVEN